MPVAKRKFRSTVQICRILAELKESGLSQRRFALKRNIPLSTLQSWLRKQGSAVTVADVPDVIPVGTISGPSPMIEIEFVGGEIMRVGAGCRGEDLRTILAELRRC